MRTLGHRRRARALEGVAVVLVLASWEACAGAPPSPAGAPRAAQVGSAPREAASPADEAGSTPSLALSADAEAADAAARVEAGPGALASGDAAAPDGAPTATVASECNEQPPQDFLVRGHFLKLGAEGNAHAIDYRTEHYGFFKGFGHPAPGAQPASAFVVDATFMGLPVKMHRKVVPALRCVEAEIRVSCVDHPYTPHALAGIRYRNTYRGGEVTNHAYGIAIDIDPAINTCCGCVAPWNDAPACKKKAASEYDRMAMPECWVHAFERYGFYWIGHDALRDTMHFEFLGDPDRILRSGTVATQN